MCKMGIHFDDSINTTANVPFIDMIANVLRDSKDKEEGYLPEEYKNVIIPMLVITRLDLVMDDETREKVRKRYEMIKDREDMTKEQKHDMLVAVAGRNFYNVTDITLEKLVSSDKDNLAKNFKEYLNGFSDNIKTLLKSFKFYAEIDKMKKCRVLSTVLNRFYNNRDMFDPSKTSDTMIGNMFEMVIRKYFATSSNGQFFTPREIIALMMNIILNDPDIDENLFKDGSRINILDMACGTGGMLSIASSILEEVNPNISVNLYGQENDPKIHAVCLSDIIIKGQDETNIKCANTLYEDSFPTQEMDFILANPPFGTDWKPTGSKNDEKSENLKDQFKKINAEVEKQEKGKYGAGLPSDGGDCQMMFIQHALHKLKKTGKACIISNNKPLFAGDVGSGESKIRKWILDEDYLEAIIKLPGQMFYNTSINIYLNIFTKEKSEDRKRKVLLINASDDDGEFNFHRVSKKSAGDKRNELVYEHVKRIVELFCEYKSSKYSKIISVEDFMLMKFTTKQAYQCDFAINKERLELFKTKKVYQSFTSNSKFSNDRLDLLKMSDELEAEEIIAVEKHNIGTKVFELMFRVLSQNISDKVYLSIDEFIMWIEEILGYSQIQIPTGKIKKNGMPSMKKVWVLAKCDNLMLDDIKKSFWNKPFNELFKQIAFDFGMHNDAAAIITDKEGNIVYNDETKDTELIQVTKKESNEVTEELMREVPSIKEDDSVLYGQMWQEKMVKRYLEKEVEPYAKNTHIVDEVVYGADWSFNKQFYVYKPLPKSTDLLREFKILNDSITSDLAEILGEL